MLDLRILLGAMLVCIAIITIGMRLIGTNETLTAALGERPDITTGIMRQASPPPASRQEARTSTAPRVAQPRMAEAASAIELAKTAAKETRQKISTPTAPDVAAGAPGDRERTQTSAAPSPPPEITGSIGSAPGSSAEDGKPPAKPRQRAAAPAREDPPSNPIEALFRLFVPPFEPFTPPIRN